MNEQMKKDLPTWESEYLAMGTELSKREKELLQGADITSKLVLIILFLIIITIP